MPLNLADAKDLPISSSSMGWRRGQHLVPCSARRKGWSNLVLPMACVDAFHSTALVAERASRTKRNARYAPPALSADSIEPFLAERLAEGTLLAREAGRAIKKVIDSAKDIENKGVNDLVTATDKANEVLIFEGLKRKFPTDRFIGEETSAANGTIDPLTDAPTWICDPVDKAAVMCRTVCESSCAMNSRLQQRLGTTNFVHGFPFTCVSIGFARGGSVELGIIYDPVKDETFQAVKGHGVWLNGKRQHASDATAMAHSLIITEYGCQREESAMDRMMAATKDVLRKSRGMRQVGSGALDLAYVACGRVDAVYSGVAGEGWKPWDYAAGLVMAQEGGAATLHCDGSQFNIFGDSVLCCASQQLADELLSVVKPHTVAA
eukprot:16689-Heterococcus_DN1.PRE.11